MAKRQPSSVSPPPPAGGAAIAAEIKHGRGVNPDTNRGAMSQDALAHASGVNFATIRWLEMGKTEDPDARILAALYDALPNSNPTDTPLLALARARWTLDPRNDPAAAVDALSTVADVLLPSAELGAGR